MLYTVVQALYDIRLAGDFYTSLDLPTGASEQDIKRRFRRLAARIHPDKLKGNAPEDFETGFVHLKVAQDTLLDPAKRFAYDRFGPRITTHEHGSLKTFREHVYAGLHDSLPEYLGGGCMLVVMNYFWLPKWGQFWRYLAFASLALLELYLLTHAWSPPPAVVTAASWVQRWLPNLLPLHILPFQLLGLAHKTLFSLNIFISRLAPPDEGTPNGNTIPQSQEQQIQYVANVAAKLDAEATGLLQLGFAPFRGRKEKVQSLRRGMKDGMVLSALRNSLEVREVVTKKLEHQRLEANGHH